MSLAGAKSSFVLPKTDVACYSVALALTVGMVITASLLKTGLGIAGSTVALAASIAFLVCAVYGSQLSAKGKGQTSIALMVFAILGLLLFGIGVTNTLTNTTSKDLNHVDPAEPTDVSLRRKVLSLALTGSTDLGAPVEIPQSLLNDLVAAPSSEDEQSTSTNSAAPSSAPPSPPTPTPQPTPMPMPPIPADPSGPAPSPSSPSSASPASSASKSSGSAVVAVIFIILVILAVAAVMCSGNAGFLAAIFLLNA
jgi:hypothetical protein